jgi:tetrahydromethanopterin S-methyltransferase subunit G
VILALLEFVDDATTIWQRVIVFLIGAMIGIPFGAMIGLLFAMIGNGIQLMIQ